MKKLYKIKAEKKICGVCAGLSEYLDLDVSLIRIIWAVFALSGVGFFAYFIAAIILPDKVSE
ncbi:MAG: PspC domain-containing protein [Clostridia bacterium]